jgi:hypothetical protein
LTFEELADPGKFPTLDTKLGAGLQKAARGELARRITLTEETEAKDGRLLKGRQILKMVYDSHKLDEAIGQVFDIENVFGVTLKGDNLAKFLQDWDTVLAGQAEPISEIILKPLLHRQLLSSPSLKEEMAHIERALPDSEDKTYAALYRVLRRRVELNRQNSNRKALQSHHAGGGHAPAAPAAKQSGRGKRNKPRGDGDKGQNRGATPRAKSRGRGKGEDAPSGVCYSFWRTGKCGTQNCKYEHRANPNPGKQNDGRNRASSRAPSAAKKPLGSIDVPS